MVNVIHKDTKSEGDAVSLDLLCRRLLVCLGGCLTREPTKNEWMVWGMWFSRAEELHLCISTKDQVYRFTLLTKIGRTCRTIEKFNVARRSILLPVDSDCTIRKYSEFSGLPPILPTIFFLWIEATISFNLFI